MFSNIPWKLIGGASIIIIALIYVIHTNNTISDLEADLVTEKQEVKDLEGSVADLKAINEQQLEANKSTLAKLNTLQKQYKEMSDRKEALNDKLASIDNKNLEKERQLSDYRVRLKDKMLLKHPDWMQKLMRTKTKERIEELYEVSANENSN